MAPTVDPRWYLQSFRGDYSEIYTHRSDEQAAREVAFVVPTLGLEAGQRVLDLCCGNGRHLQALAGHGLQLVGLDRSAELLAEARDRLPADVTLLQSDMRHVPVNGGFDAVLNFFTSFGYFQDPADNQQVLQSIARALRPRE